MLLTNPFLFRKTVRLSVAKAGLALATPSVQVRRSYRLQADPAAMTVSGQSVTLRRALQLAMPVRTYTVAPVASRLLAGRKVSATVGLWAITGRSAVLFKSRVAGFVKTEFLVSGQVAELRRNLKLSATAATLTLSPRTVGMLKVAGQISALPASVAIAGQAVLLRAARRLTLLNATYVMAGQQARMLRTYPLQASPAAFAIAGQSAILKMGRRLSAVKADYNLAFPSQAMVYTPTTPIDAVFLGLIGSGSNLTSYSGSVTAATSGKLIVMALAGNQGGSKPCDQISIGSVLQTLQGGDGDFNWAMTDVTPGTIAVASRWGTGTARQDCGMACFLLTNPLAEGLVGQTGNWMATQTSRTLSLPVKAGGVLLCHHFHNSTATTNWSGATEVADATLGIRYSSAIYENDATTDEASHAATASWSGGSNAVLYLLSFR